MHCQQANQFCKDKTIIEIRKRYRCTRRRSIKVQVDNYTRNVFGNSTLITHFLKIKKDFRYVQSEHFKILSHTKLIDSLVRLLGIEMEKTRAEYSIDRIIFLQYITSIIIIKQIPYNEINSHLLMWILFWYIVMELRVERLELILQVLCVWESVIKGHWRYLTWHTQRQHFCLR